MEISDGPIKNKADVDEEEEVEEAFGGGFHEA
jgi:hypothetical protein